MSSKWDNKISPPLHTNEMEIINLFYKEFKAIVIKMLTKLGKWTKKHSENFNKELENIKENQSELKNTVTEIKNKLKLFNIWLGDIECLSDLEDRIVEISESEP